MEWVFKVFGLACAPFRGGHASDLLGLSSLAHAYRDIFSLMGFPDAQGYEWAGILLEKMNPSNG